MKKTILVIDDNEAILDSVGMILRDIGYEVAGRRSGDTIREDIKALSPDLILLDIWLSGEDGVAISKRLKEDEETLKIPVVLISAASHIKEYLVQSKADDYLTKPFEIDALIEKVQKFT